MLQGLGCALRHAPSDELRCRRIPAWERGYMYHAPATARAPRVCTLINPGPRRACAARVTVHVHVVVLSF